MTWDGATIRQLERASIRAFVEGCTEHLAGRVLDFGCGLQPYRQIVEQAGGDYHPFDRARFPANVSADDVGDVLLLTYRYDAVLCTQVAQYWASPAAELRALHGLLRPGGALILTYPTAWDVIEPADLWRFTRAGMDHLLRFAGFKVERHQERAAVELPGFRFPLGHGVIARAGGDGG